MRRQNAHVLRIPKQLITLLISEESILFRLFYNTRIVLNNTKVTIVGSAFLLKTTDPTLCPLSPVPRSALVSFVKFTNFPV